jgi:hypothetical protein
LRTREIAEATGMTNIDPTGTPEGPVASRRRAVIIGSVAGGVVVLGVIAALVISVAAGGPTPTDVSASPSASASASQSPSASASPSTSPSASASANATPATPDDRFGLPVVAEVPSSEPATVAGATVSIDGITVEQVSGTRAGETAGPAARVVVRVVNPSDGASLDLSAVAVRAYTGQDFAPASPVDEGTGFSGSLAPGETATGTYLFSIPEGAQDSVTVTVGVTADSGLAVFTP